MRKLDKDEYCSAAGLIDTMRYGGVYPLSIAENIQQGEIYTDGDSILFHHYCGFAFVFGKGSESFLTEVYERFLSGASDIKRRFFLFLTDDIQKAFFSQKNGLLMEKRVFFEYKGNDITFEMPSNIRLVEADRKLLENINGRITPKFSWDSYDDLLRHGKCYCALDGDIPAAWAFSAAVSSRETDIGVETDEKYRHMGLAAAVSRKMAEYVLGTGKMPVWACHSENKASWKLAEKIGFIKSAECYTVKR